ncbi:type III restriction-modification system endonuclease [Streptococcus ruminicola]|uniref:Type III restriction-modification system endonuclease n=1 Tax=Streptococcus ruminicola TaxID=2686210 RepID=A0AAE6UYT1_9STRE|nr:type III restriction-modification system endonuclease [Streptococcus ruminicola]QGZ27375.1 type III restriction-modification system endonuclease [Streptococcus ruminicola]
MKILLEELPHQEKSLENLIKAFPPLDKHTTDPDKDFVYANPILYYRDRDDKNIDIKMETGTGKTYVYTRAMYELHQRFGIFKFVIVVPTPAIKEGTKNFIQSSYAKQHFAQFYGNTRIDLNVINAGDFKARSGRKNFPAHLTNFIEGSRQNANTIQVLLINAGMLNSKSMKKSDYDQTLIGGTTQPLEAIKQTRPVVIIDEPHRFPRDKANYKAIEALKPQTIIRFGATFPDVTVGRGRNKQIKKDYYRGEPQYNLNAIDSFNDGLVKGIDIFYPNLSEQQAKKSWVVDKVSAKELTLKQGNIHKTLYVGDNLSDVDDGFEGDVVYAGSKALSNDLELSKGMILIPGTFQASYQEMIIEDALNEHFRKEQENFFRLNNAPKIKTLSLFFIDSIKSYRDSDGWLKKTFERLLTKKLEELIAKYDHSQSQKEIDYLEFLRATQKSLQSENQNVHAGYFGEDKGSGDEAVQAEVDDILKNKNKLLSFKDEHGNWVTRRFLFSKWTLREGWDNPNVFVIAKLRTSGSDNSKIQEVGRGLRLPVDETGHRVRQEEFESRLSFHIGYDEREFAQKLVGEINSDCKLLLNHEKLDENMIKLILDDVRKTQPKFDEEDLLEQLDKLNIINCKNEFKENVEIEGKVKSGFEWLLEYYPILSSIQLRDGKVNNNPKKSSKRLVKLNQENWKKVKELWKVFSKRHMLIFERKAEEISKIAKEVFSNTENYQREAYTYSKQELISKEDQVDITDNPTQEYVDKYRSGMPYGAFIKEIAQKTDLPIKDIHPHVLKSLKELNNSEYLSYSSVKKLVRNFKAEFEKTYSQSYHYEALDFQARTSIFDPRDDSFVESVSSGLLGVNQLEGVSEDSRNLYYTPPVYYDSIHPEKDLLTHGYAADVTVFGKLPKSAIKVPKYTGGTTTPDFIYVLENGDDSSIYLLVEGKADNMREGDRQIIQNQEKFFEQLDKFHIEYQVATDAQDVYQKIDNLLNSKK